MPVLDSVCSPKVACKFNVKVWGVVVETKLEKSLTALARQAYRTPSLSPYHGKTIVITHIATLIPLVMACLLWRERCIHGLFRYKKT